MKDIDIYKFDNFIKVWRSDYYGIRADQCMRELGFKSARLTHSDDGDIIWLLSEEEYTWFILRWS
jgi:hypothetical protein